MQIKQTLHRFAPICEWDQVAAMEAERPQRRPEQCQGAQEAFHAGAEACVVGTLQSHVELHVIKRVTHINCSLPPHHCMSCCQAAAA